MAGRSPAPWRLSCGRAARTWTPSTWQWAAGTTTWRGRRSRAGYWSGCGPAAITRCSRPPRAHPFRWP
eukprot:4559065-Pleurochrysis_carterae.AAC.1